jgi:hypothetical protein
MGTFCFIPDAGSNSEKLLDVNIKAYKKHD